MVSPLYEGILVSGLNLYQEEALTTKLLTPDYYAYLKLAGEVGEVCEKYGKLIRDKGGVVSEEDRQQLKLELGDVFWYLASIADSLQLTLGEVALANLQKLASRKQRNVIQGNGDNR